MEKRRPGENITHEMRALSNETTVKELRYRQILNCLGDRKMTAKEVAVAMHLRGYTPTDERNFAAPRLTELSKMGLVEPVGKKRCQYTGKMVSVYEVRNG